MSQIATCGSLPGEKEMKGLAVTISVILVLSVATLAQTTAFNYQGRLTEGGNPANGAFQMQFKLFDSLGGAGQVGSTLNDVPVTATQGTFAVKLDFGANALSGANRWLEISVRHNSGESYTTLAPREQIASSPYAVRTLSAASADNALQLGGIAASEYVTTTNGGSSFIRNGTIQQTGNLNISGKGTFSDSVLVGNSISNFGFKMYVVSDDGEAIFGQTKGVGRAIYGASSSGYAGFFQGQMYMSGNVGIDTSNPQRLLHVNGRARIGVIPPEPSAASVCFNASGDLLQCGGSSMRWKTNVTQFAAGLDIIRRLRPINFNWKDSGQPDIGLGAEEVAGLAPELTFKNQDGEVTGVKYERLNMLLINAVKELELKIERQQATIDSLRALVCPNAPNSRRCKEVPK